MVQVPRLRALRQRRVLSQDELARLAGVSATTVNSVEGGASARYITVRKLAQALGVSPEELAQPEEEKAIA